MASFSSSGPHFVNCPSVREAQPRANDIVVPLADSW